MIRVLAGDCRGILPTLAANSVQCCITSPPYYGLRDYGVANQIGREATPDEWLAAMVGVFREVRRVLRADGTLWLNVGDSYAHDSKGTGGATLKQASNVGSFFDTRSFDHGLKPKDLMLLPARLAIALQNDGWWVRSDIIWSKPNPMPESVTDRPTLAHEHIFLLSKSARYYYDADAVREPQSDSTTERWNGTPPRLRVNGQANWMPSVGESSCGINPAGRNLRNVWTIAPEAFPESHFATYPTALVERCIKAGTSERGCCAACGRPWVRIIETQPDNRVPYATIGTGTKARECRQDGKGLNRVLREDGRGGSLAMKQRTTAGWSPACQCNAATVPCVVLDPFLGAGTSALVADRLNRDCIGIELNPAYVAMAQNRITADCPLFAEVAD